MPRAAKSALHRFYELQGLGDELASAPMLRTTSAYTTPNSSASSSCPRLPVSRAPRYVVLRRWSESQTSPRRSSGAGCLTLPPLLTGDSRQGEQRTGGRGRSRGKGAPSLARGRLTQVAGQADCASAASRRPCSAAGFQAGKAAAHRALPAGPGSKSYRPSKIWLQHLLIP